MKEIDVLDMFRARVDNYAVSRIKPLRGRLYEVTMNGEYYRAVVLSDSFAFYELRYHLAQQKPTLVICYMHNTVLPIPVLSMRVGNFARAYELPEEIEDIEQQRHSKLGAQVILGMYLSGLRAAQTIVKSLPTSTRDRYLRKAKAFGRRKRGRPVGLRTV
jgi:hypothetical protein